MPECHSCPHFQSDEWRHVPFRLTPCAKCSLSDHARHKGRSHVSRDSNSAAVDNLELRQIQEREDTAYSGEEYFSRGVLQDGLRHLLELMDESPRTAHIVLYRICSPTRPLKGVAQRLGISVQAAHSRLKRARKRWPNLAKIIPMRAYRGRDEVSDAE